MSPALTKSQQLLNIKFTPRASKQFRTFFSPHRIFFAAKFALYQSAKLYYELPVRPSVRSIFQFVICNLQFAMTSSRPRKRSPGLRETHRQEGVRFRVSGVRADFPTPDT